jgi:hypothetical protein
VSTQVAASVSLPAPDAPDRDFDGLVARALTAIQYTQGTAGAWTDHNTHDPGITLLEAALWALADLHYRTAARSFGGWNAEVRDWRGPGLPTADLERKLLLARAALDHADAVETAVAASGDDDATARAKVGAALTDEGLVDAEVVALVTRERRRLLARFLADHPDEIRELIADSNAGAVLADLQAKLVLDVADAPLALAVEPAPPAEPELWEDAWGRTTLWPPHPIQTRSCDPVTTRDYLRLASAQDEVKRAWIVPGLAVGVRYDGTPQTVELPLRRGALTILVEPVDKDATYRDAAGGLNAAGKTFLAGVLEGVTGVAPADEPAISYGNKNIEPADGAPTGPPWRSRRLLGDELGAALICRRSIVVGGTLEIAPTADQAGVLLRADAALAGFLSAEKTGLDDPPPPPPQSVFPEAIDGPWPNAVHARAAMSGAPATGWEPGESVRVSEVVELLQALDGVIGVDGLTIAVAAALPVWHHDLLAMGTYCIPAYEHHCLCVRIVDARSCDD